MAIQNGIGLTSFTRNRAEYIEGQPADMDLCKARPYRNPVLPQISTITIAGFGTDADEVNVDITLPSGVVATVTTTRAAGVPSNDAAAATALAVLINALALLNGHASAVGDGDDLVITFDQAGIEYPVATRVTGSTATVVTTQAAGGLLVPFGRFIAAGSSVDGQPALRPLTTSDTSDSIRGVVLRPQMGVNAGSALASAVDAVAIGDMAAVGYDGNVAMRNNGSVAAAPGGQVYAVVATTGGDEIGEARANASGTTQVATITAVADQPVYAIEFGYLGEHYSFQYVPTDNTTTTDVAIDGLEDAAGAVVPTGVTASNASAAATMTLTAAAGTTFDYVRSTAFGLDTPAASASVSVAASGSYAIPLDREKFYWVEATPAGAVGPVMVRA